MMQHRFDELEGRLRTFVTQRDWDQFHSPKNMAICLSVEASELLTLYTWTESDERQGAPGTEAPSKEAVADEAADVFLSLLSFCRSAGVDLLDASHRKLSKLSEKYPVDLAKGSAIKDPTRTGSK